MNAYDLIVLALLFLGALAGCATGLMRSVFNLCSWGFSLAISYALHPPFSKFLRTVGLAAMIQEKLSDVIDLGFITENASHAAQMEMLDKFPQSEFILRQLQANNNPVAYLVFGAATIKEYIVGFFANMIVNLIAILIIWILARTFLKLVSTAIGLVEKLPVVRAFNRAGGAIFGFVSMVILIWAAMCVLNFFFLFPKYDYLFKGISEGPVSSFFYKLNPLFGLLSAVLP
ncbi:MAG: CvpA family protein [Clostridiales bacterium]|jgi:uncharacterized membrane protein required for colicin V production|nr:CvpA family protein [Clostridiales bacterium]MDR2749743.1 CvpA family protein [Clostridiales bacterium]